MWSVEMIIACSTVSSLGPTTRPLMVLPGRSTAVISCGGSPALTS